MQAGPSPVPQDVNLDNCDREPIHIPGHIQPHGALLAFDRGGVLRWVSGNASDVLDVALPALGERLGLAHFDGEAVVALAVAGELATAPEAGAVPRQHDVALAGRHFHLMLHHSGELLVAEFEPQAPDDDAAAFAIQAHRGLDRLRRARSQEELLEIAVQEVRILTGFDRVMAYRFRHDGSGEVAAESREASLEPFLDRRYPAADIPAQARRLYIASTLRLIADVRAQPAPLLGREPQPLDLSHSVLRSVSPVHIEYLNNLGVGASMSVSIVIGDALWGMIACHHGTARHVPYGLRMACDVLAQVLAARLQSLEAAEHGRRIARAASLRSRMVESLLVTDDTVAALAPSAAEVALALDAEAVVVAEGGRLALHGGIEEPAARALLGWLEAPDVPLQGGLLAISGRAALPPALAQALGPWCGILGLRHDEATAGWVLVLRREQVETIAWGGRPEKHYVNGPLGPRLTPRGSFQEWRETVRDTAVPWSPTDLEIGRQLLDELGRASAARHAELVRARNQLLAVLGHDLRNPLQAISMSSHLLERGADTAKVGQRIQSATSRMQRLIGQVLDMSRLQSGLGLGFAIREVELRELVEALADEVTAALPGTVIDRRLPEALRAHADPDRLSQLLSNLLSNSRHHGAAGRPVTVQLEQDGDHVVLRVRNPAPPIPEDVASQLFSPYKRQSVGNTRNKGGLGLGLYIAHEIARGHGGSLAYTYEDPDVVFTARWPARPPGAGTD